MQHLLSYLVFLPMIGAFLILGGIKNNVLGNENKIRLCAFVVSILTLVLSCFIYYSFDKQSLGFQFSEESNILENSFLKYHIGIDSIALCFILLTTILTPICLLASWKSISKRIKEFVVCFLLLESFTLGVFVSLDLMLFYIFFEALLVPMFLIIGIWGGENKVYATLKFFLYTLAGSLLLLIAIIYIYNQTSSLDIITLYKELPKLNFDIQKALWLMMFAAFAIKVPMWPVHTWLPDAHVQAPTAGSVILAGVLLKVGAFGFIRISIPMLPAASFYFADFMYILSAIAVIYASFVAFAQRDIKKLIAYSSIAHMGYVTMGLFTFKIEGIEGSIIQMISHGLISGALFLCVGVLYDRAHTKEITNYGGVVNRMPKFAFIFMLFTMASVGLPGTSGFVGEAIILFGTFAVNKVAALVISFGLVVGAVYMLSLYKRVMFGEINNKIINDFKDLSFREIIVFAPLLILVLLLGIYPKLLTDLLHIPVEKIIVQVIDRPIK